MLVEIIVVPKFGRCLAKGVELLVLFQGNTSGHLCSLPESNHCSLKLVQRRAAHADLLIPCQEIGSVGAVIDDGLVGLPRDVGLGLEKNFIELPPHPCYLSYYLLAVDWKAQEVTCQLLASFGLSPFIL